MHADLFRADYWRALQTRIKEGHVEDVGIHRRRQRFSVLRRVSRVRRTLRKPVPSPDQLPRAQKGPVCRFVIRCVLRSPSPSSAARDRRSSR